MGPGYWYILTNYEAYIEGNLDRTFLLDKFLEKWSIFGLLNVAIGFYIKTNTY